MPMKLNKELKTGECHKGAPVFCRRVVQNAEAFAFTDALLGGRSEIRNRGSLQEGRRIWLLAKLPDKYIIEGEQIEPYLVFSSSHDGSGAIKLQ